MGGKSDARSDRNDSTALTVAVEPQRRKQGSGGNAILFIGGLILAGFAISKCSPSSKPQNASAISNNLLDSNLKSAVAAQTPPPVEPLSLKRVKAGQSDFKVADAAEGLSGDMIYSQNCYDALSTEFSWSGLDTCGAFDMRAVASADDADSTLLGKEVAYFEAEAAAGRYLAAATGAGENPDKADQRLSKLQDRIARSIPESQQNATGDSGLADVGNDIGQADPLNLTGSPNLVDSE